MTTWILLIILNSPDSKAISSIEFTSKEKCVAAQVQLPKYTSAFHSYNAHCFEK